jgi:hypothetical protein
MTKFSSCITAGALLLLSTAAAKAQELKLEVPFAFSTSKAQMPAGKYVVSRVSTITSTPMFRFDHESGQSTIVVAADRVIRPNGETATPQVAFRCVKEECALSAVFESNESDGRGVPISPKRFNEQRAKVTTVVIAAR